MPEVMEFKKIDANFYQPGNMIIAIRGPDPVKLEALTDEVTALLEDGLVCEQSKTVDECKAEELYARHIYGKLPDEWLADHTLRLAKPKDAKRLRDLLADPRLPAFLEHLNDDFESEYTDVDNVVEQERQIVSSLDAVQEFVKTIDAASAETIEDSRVVRNVRDLTIGKPYFFSLDNTMSLVMVAPSVGTDDVEAMPAMDRKIESLLAPFALEYPNYRFERTGMIAIGRDEMDSVGPQTILITVVALAIIFLILVWNFRSSMTPILALIPIILGIIWSTGVVALTLGSMNLFTVMMGVVLLGLGIDFSIHIANRFHEEVVARQSIEEALRLALGETGLGVITGAVTTSVAFFTLMIADTKGIKEFGFCTGTGVLVTLAAVMLVLPALLATWAERRMKRKKPIKTSHDFSLLGDLAEWMGRRRAGVIVVSVLATALGMYAGTQLDWEWNWMELEPEGLRSVELQDEIIDAFKLSISLSMLTAESVEESRALRKTFKDRRVVGDVDDVSLWLSRPDFDESSIYIRDLKVALEKGRQMEANGPSVDTEAGRARLAEELDRLWANIVEIQALSFTGGQDRIVDKTTQLVSRREDRESGLLRQVADRFAAADDIHWESFERFSEDFAHAMRNQALRMAEGDAPVTLDMVPADIRAKYISDTVPGFLMQIFPKKNLYEREDLEIFQEVAARVHPKVTGLPQMFLKMNLETIREGKLAFFAAIGVILLVLLLDFRRPLVAVLAFLPLISGLALMMGVMWLLSEKLNYLNLIAFPVIIGIGVDDGVHFFRRFIQEGKGGLGRAVTSVGRAMLMTSLTTMIGFGSLMLYLMRGMASLGLVLFVGVGTCLVVTFTLLPALAKLFEDRIVAVRR
jgi:predicted RND superfamily exporter protein